ncbi:Gfo/Idh/MocA family oxidoreductase [bacterium]|nr:Gfo/Idh/MocA family oxidoreductase [bacterium]
MNWLLVGTGQVVYDFGTQLSQISGQKIGGIVSRKQEKADQLAAQIGVSSCHQESLERALETGSFNVAYIASPSSLHTEHARACLENGCSVLVEKPFATDPREAEETFAFATERNLFCMEGMWLHFSPLVEELERHLSSAPADSSILANLSCGYRTQDDRLSDPSRGAVWDFSVYALHLLLRTLGAAKEGGVSISATKPAAHFSAHLEFQRGHAVLQASVEQELANTAHFFFLNKQLSLTAPFIAPPALTSSGPEFPGSAIKDRIAKLKNAINPGSPAATRTCLTVDPQLAFRRQAEHVIDQIEKNESSSLIVPPSLTIAAIKLARTLSCGSAAQS